MSRRSYLHVWIYTISLSSLCEAACIHCIHKKLDRYILSIVGPRQSLFSLLFSMPYIELLWYHLVYSYLMIVSILYFILIFITSSDIWIISHYVSSCNDGMSYMSLLPDTWNCGLRMRRECRERFPRHRLRRKSLVSDPGMHHGTYVPHVPWCMSGSLTCYGGGNVPDIPGACATRNFTYLARGPCLIMFVWSVFPTWISNYIHYKVWGEIT